MNNLIGKIVPADCPYCATNVRHEIITLSHRDDVEEFLYPTLKCLKCQRALGHRDLDGWALFERTLDYEFTKRCSDVQITVIDFGRSLLGVKTNALLAITDQNFTRELWPEEELVVADLVNLLQKEIYRLQLITAQVDLDIQIRDNRWLLSGNMRVATRVALHQAQCAILSIDRIGRCLAAGLDQRHTLHFTYTQTFLT